MVAQDIPQVLRQVERECVKRQLAVVLHYVLTRPKLRLTKRQHDALICKICKSIIHQIYLQELRQDFVLGGNRCRLT